MALFGVQSVYAALTSTPLAGTVPSESDVQMLLKQDGHIIMTIVFHLVFLLIFVIALHNQLSLKDGGEKVPSLPSIADAFSQW